MPHGCTHCGVGHIDPDDLSAISRVCRENGFQLHAHVIGDGALDEILKAWGSGPSRHPPDLLAHLQVVRPEQVPRIVASGAAAVFSPFWAQV
mmetsp:Transcript_44268/g.96047  ORF Transcript_44268/g.96047 Transcript_44268/m.96047 type:complete len:92 (-) Transcript_44268:58-333(-)